MTCDCDDAIALTSHSSLGTVEFTVRCGHSLMVKFQPSKLAMRVRFPLPAHLPMKNRLFRPPKTNKVRHRPFLSFDSPVARIFALKGRFKSPFGSEFRSERPFPAYVRLNFCDLVVQQSKDGAVGFTLALLVFWSRLYLRRHDLRETLVGAFLGLLGGLVTAW